MEKENKPKKLSPKALMNRLRKKFPTLFFQEYWERTEDKERKLRTKFRGCIVICHVFIENKIWIGSVVESNEENKNYDFLTFEEYVGEDRKEEANKLKKYFETL